MQYQTERTEQSGITAREIKAAVADAFHVSIEAMEGPDRRRASAEPRHVAFLLCRRHTQLRVSEIGRLFGGRDHSTVCKTARTVEGYIQTDPDLRDRYERARQALLAEATA